MNMIVSWTYVRDEDTFAGTLLVNLSKAFDFMVHSLLMVKMSAHCLSNDEFM